MDNGLFISLLNPAIALTLASAFLLLWLYRRNRFYLVMLAAAYLGSAPGFLLQYFTLPAGLAATKLLSNIFFTLSAFCLAGAIAARFGDRSRGKPWASWASAGSPPSPGSCSSIPT